MPKIEQFFVVHAQKDERMHFFAHQKFDFGVVVAFVGAAEYQHNGRFHALQRIPARVHIGGFRVVDVAHAAHRSHIFQAVFHALKFGQRLANRLFANMHQLRRQASRHRIVNIVRATQCQFVDGHFQVVFGFGRLDIQVVLLDKRPSGFGFAERKRQQFGFDVAFFDFGFQHRIVVPIDERIFGRLVLQNAKFRVDIVLKFMVVAVEMVGRNVQNDRHIGFEIVHAIELERTEFQHIEIEIALGHLPRKTFAHIARQTHIQPFVFQDEIGEHRGGCFAVRACDTDFFCIGIACGKLDFGDDGRTLLAQGANHRRSFGNARTFHHFVGVKNQRVGVSVLFVRQTTAVEFGLVFGFQCALVRQEHIVALFFCQNGRSNATFAASKNH